jgi:hypothetical protein
MMREWLTAAIFVATAIFTAGGIVLVTRRDLWQNKQDINRVGSKVREDEKAEARRHHNMCMVQIASEDDRDTRFKIAGMLKED